MSGAMSQTQGRVKIGLFNEDLAESRKLKLRPLLDQAFDEGYQFIVAPLRSPIDGKMSREEQDLAFVDDFEISSKGDGKFTPDWRTHVNGFLRFETRGLEGFKAEELLDREISYAAHLGVAILYIDCGSLTRSQLVRVTRIVNSQLQTSWGMSGGPEIRILLPISSSSSSPVQMETNGTTNGYRYEDDEEDEDMKMDSWSRCALARDLAHPDSRLGVSLDLGGDLPDEEEIKRWLGERVQSLVIPTSCFVTNKSGFPVLPSAHQDLIRRFVYYQSFRIDLLVRQVPPPLTADGTETVKPTTLLHYFQYLDYLKQQVCTIDESLAFIRGYEDMLQIPLQPLKDNLESSTYAVFEHDPVKYLYYQKAILAALKDKKTAENGHKIVIMVLGAGRGPLVTASLKAAEELDLDVKMLVIEKNPHAVSTLRHMQLTKSEWLGKDITIYGCDMRDLSTSLKADIIVSELLGSLGDNELSPECLSGIGSYMKRDGVCIPGSYNSYIHPIMSHRLFSDTNYFSSSGSRTTMKLPTDSGYVVCLRNVYSIDEPQKLFTFDHTNQLKLELGEKCKNEPLNDGDELLEAKPKRDEFEESSRFSQLSFTAKIDCTMHGLGGYFDTHLYGDVKLSTHPSDHTPGMFSWFPFWIPLREAVPLRAGEKMTVNFWRVRNARKVWYEWCLTQPKATKIQNVNGKTSSISLF